MLRIIVAGAVSGTAFGLVTAGGAKALPRPPGALVEPEFLKACARCYQCIDICPADALHPASILDGMANIGTPALEWKKCIMCMECIKICPTGAIQKIAKSEMDIGNAVIARETCLQWSGKEACDKCFRACRYKAILLDEKKNPTVVEGNCNGCGACERRCPVKPIKSITVIYDKVKRFDPPKERILVRSEDRTGAEGERKFFDWFEARIQSLAERYGLWKEEE
jgi:ferredoxin-type protein NapG